MSSDLVNCNDISNTVKAYHVWDSEIKHGYNDPGNKWQRGILRQIMAIMVKWKQS